jgi:hypothetical protein
VGGLGIGGLGSGRVKTSFGTVFELSSLYSSTSIFVTGERALFFSRPRTSGSGRVAKEIEEDPVAYLIPSTPLSPPVLPVQGRIYPTKWVSKTETVAKGASTNRALR